MKDEQETGLQKVVSLIPAMKRDLVLSPVMDLTVARARMAEFQEFVAHYLEPSADGGTDGGDYGPIPSAGKKKVLLKSGADKLVELYGLYDEYDVDAKEDFDTKLFYYKVKCVLRSRRDDSVVGTGLGSCSTYESKYRWRDTQRQCPKCNAETIIKGKDFSNTGKDPGWLCWGKKGGCGVKFPAGDQSIESQKIGRMENPDIMDTVNTVLKMAKKRAKIDAVIGVTRSSGIFTQDLEDVPMPPEKPTVPRTTEDIPINGPVKSTAADRQPTVKGEAEPKETVDSAEGGTHATVEDTAAHETSAGEFIDLPRQRALHRAFKDAIPNAEARKGADAFFRDWLVANKFIGEDGNGSTKKVRMSEFDDVKRRAVAFAESLPR